jgi:uncharacterized membrane protein YgcG
MNRPETRHVAAFAWLMLAAWISICSGCQSSGCPPGVARDDPHGDFPPGAVPAPAGTYRDQWHAAQSARADRDFFVFYLYEWRGESDRLSPFGERHLARTVQRAAHTPHPLVVEPSGDALLDQRRVVALQIALAAYDAAWGAYPVVLGHSEAEPLYGFESPRVLRGFTDGGQGGGQGGGMGGGMGGGGMGGGGMGGGGMGGGRGAF